MASNKSAFRTVAITIIIASALIFFIYWLWQRQPRSTQKQEITSPITTHSKNDTKKQEESFLDNPKDTEIGAEKVVKFKGKANPNTFILIYSNDLQKITKTNETGSFETDVTLVGGLNLIDIVEVGQDSKETRKQQVTIYLTDKDKKTNAKTVFAGLVKNIFDNLITLTTQSDEKTVRKTSSTDITATEIQNIKETKPPDIRVGDYLLALGNTSSENEISAVTIEIFRENKPQNNKKYMLAKILSVPRQNVFSAKNQQDNKTVEFSLQKATTVSNDGKEGSPKDITKDKNVIIFYSTTNNKNSVDLIYLLP